MDEILFWLKIRLLVANGLLKNISGAVTISIYNFGTQSWTVVIGLAGSSSVSPPSPSPSYMRVTSRVCNKNMIRFSGLQMLTPNLLSWPLGCTTVLSINRKKPVFSSSPVSPPARLFIHCELEGKAKPFYSTYLLWVFALEDPLAFCNVPQLWQPFTFASDCVPSIWQQNEQK